MQWINNGSKLSGLRRLSFNNSSNPIMSLPLRNYEYVDYNLIVGGARTLATNRYYCPALSNGNNLPSKPRSYNVGSEVT